MKEKHFRKETARGTAKEVTKKAANKIMAGTTPVLPTGRKTLREMEL